MGSVDGDAVQHSHRQRKRLSEPPAAVIGVGDLIGIFIDRQHAIGNRAANPIARLGCIKAARKHGEIKGSVAAHLDFVRKAMTSQ